MLVSLKLKPAVALLALTLALTGCKSAEEKIQEYYASAVSLAEEGDYELAILELRNIFQIDGGHRDSRYMLAELQLNELNEPRRAYRNFLRVAEQYPDDLDARIQLSRLTFRASDWEEFERHSQRAQELEPDDVRVQAIEAVRVYREAVLADDAALRQEQVRKANTILGDLPDSIILRSILIDHDTQEGDFRDALTGIDWLLERDPENQTYWRQRLGVLAQMDDVEAIETQLLEMVKKFPEDTENKQALIRFFLSRGQTDEVENFLRAEAENASDDNPTPTLDLLAFLERVRGIEAVREELGSVIATHSNPIPFEIMLATLDYQSGDQAGAISAIETLLSETTEPSDDIEVARVTLAQMLQETGNEVGARTLIEEVLANDAAQPAALKMRAAWQIQADETDAAIANLRTVLDVNPDDAQAMSIMSAAYERAGRMGLSRDFLSLAVEASNNAPAESLRYARLLIQEERYLPAEDVLLPALRLAPDNMLLLNMLGELYLVMEDFGRAEQVVQTLDRLEEPEAKQAAIRLESALINQRSGSDDAIEYLEGLANEVDAPLGARIALIQARLSTGDPFLALKLAEEMKSDFPESRSVTAVLATVEAANGNLDKAEGLYRSLVEEDGTQTRIWLSLMQLKMQQAQLEEAEQILEEALKIQPQDANLLWAKASYSERNGDIDTAISIYEELYAQNSGDIIVANNLASLLSAFKTDEASLERAWAVARRLRDTKVPAMQDTFGWLLHRQGEIEEALPYLEAAARELTRDPIVQFHLGHNYLALGREDEAYKQFERVLEVAGPIDQRDQIMQARELLKERKNGAATGTDNH